MIDCHVLVESGITKPNSKYHSECKMISIFDIDNIIR